MVISMFLTQKACHGLREGNSFESAKNINNE